MVLERLLRAHLQHLLPVPLKHPLSHALDDVGLADLLHHRLEILRDGEKTALVEALPPSFLLEVARPFGVQGLLLLL